MDFHSANINFVIANCYEPTTIVKKRVRPTFYNDNLVIKNATPCERVVVKRALGYADSRLYTAPRMITPRKPLLNTKGQFFVYVSRKTPYVQLLINKAQALGLTVSGDGTNKVTGGDITNAVEGNYITFGSSPRFDMNWARRDEYMCEKGYIPVYDIEDDWGTILLAIKEFANNQKKKTYRTCDGGKTTFHAGFAVVNGVVKKYGKDEVAVRMPVDTYERVLDHGIRKVAVIY